MTPEAIQALRDVAEAVEINSTKTAALSDVLLQDQKDARARERQRFRTVYRALAGLGVGLGVVLLLVGVVVVQGIRSDIDRDERAELAMAQRRCSDTVMAEALVRVSIYATRSGTDQTAMAHLQETLAAAKSNDFAALIRLRDEIDALLRALPAGNTELREAARKANNRLLHVRDICYQANVPEDPLAD